MAAIQRGSSTDPGARHEQGNVQGESDCGLRAGWDDDALRSLKVSGKECLRGVGSGSTGKGVWVEGVQKVVDAALELQVDFEDSERNEKIQDINFICHFHPK